MNELPLYVQIYGLALHFAGGYELFIGVDEDALITRIVHEFILVNGQESVEPEVLQDILTYVEDGEEYEAFLTYFEYSGDQFEKFEETVSVRHIAESVAEVLAPLKEEIAEIVDSGLPGHATVMLTARVEELQRLHELLGGLR